jgi:AcrR family transcriptional regulator
MPQHLSESPSKAVRARKPPKKVDAPRRTQTLRRQEAEQKIMQAAMEIVARRGSVRMTLAEVGEAAGYSRGLPAHRFGNKAGLLRMLAVNIDQRFEARRMAPPVQRPGLEGVRGFVTTYFVRDDNRWIETRALLVMMTEAFMEDSELRVVISTYLRSALKNMELQIRSGIQNGEIRGDIDPPTTAAMLIGAMRGILHQWLILDEIDLVKARDLMLQVIDLALVAPRPARPKK